ncbi:MAG: zinc ABC transporter substrate-binding protein [Paracoccaceae bacterium]
MRSKILAVAGAAALASGAAAEAGPRVAADVLPVHSLAALVMQGVGEPALVLPPGASPHGHALRPSEAAALENAEVVFWVGEELTPWLADALETLAPEARRIALIDAPGVRRLEFREGVTFEAHDHGPEDDHAHDDHAHDDHAHDDHAHGDHAHDEPHAHDHEGVDPHAWLDPANARAWLDAIAAALAEADPANAAAYRANAEAGKAGLTALEAEIAADLAPLAGRDFVVFHDAYHYFEARFGVEAAGAISLADGSTPGPRRLAEIREAIAGMDAACVFTEPQFPPRLAETATQGTGARLGTLDPVGAELAPGPELYPTLIRNMAASLKACLDPTG